MTISCSMIVRDNAATLERALASVRPYVDELVIVDTGSVDGTAEIALRYADCLVGFDWCDDFSAARNHALNLCTGDWVMWLDSDDELVGGEHLRELCNTAPADMCAYMLYYVTDRTPDGRNKMGFWRERLLRRGAGRWVGRAHEVLLPIAGGRYDRCQNVHVEHHGHNTPQQSLTRNIRLLELDLADDPTNTRTLFYLGRDLITLGELDRGRAVLERYIALAVWADEAFIAQTLIGYSYRAQGRYPEGYAADLELLRVHADWPQAWFALAEDCYYLQRWDWSVLYCDLGRSLAVPETNLFISQEAMTYDWMIYQAVSLYRSGQLQAAMELTEQALAIHPYDPQHRHNHAYFASELAAIPALATSAGI